MLTLHKQSLPADLPEEAMIIPSSQEELIFWGPSIRYFLEKQPTSYEELWSLADWCLMLAEGKLTACLYVRKGEVLGLAVISFNEYGNGRKSVRVEFVSCDKFFAIAKMMLILEERARLMGIYMIEAIAEKRLADYTVKKQGFTADAVYITKKLKPIRRH